MSSPTLALGAAPGRMLVTFTRGADLSTGLRRADGSTWPVGSTLALRFSNGTTYPATYNGTDAVWTFDKTVVATLDTADVSMADMAYTEGTLDLILYRGRVTFT